MFLTPVLRGSYRNSERSPCPRRAPAGPVPSAAMPSETLRDFLTVLEREGELARVKAKVSPVLEIAQVSDRMSKSPAPHGHNELDRSPAGLLGGKALLFENVEGSEIPVAINIFG